jgi:hypothetical protein
MASWPPDLEPTPEERAARAESVATQGPCYEEIQAAHAILDLARFGVLDRVRTCHCGTWFYAARSNRVHCGESCKHKRYANSDQFRKHRREYARELYKLKKKGIGAFSKNAKTVKTSRRPFANEQRKLRAAGFTRYSAFRDHCSEHFRWAG